MTTRQGRCLADGAAQDEPVDQRHLARTLLLPAARDYADLVAAGLEAARKASEMTPDHRLAPVERVLIAYRTGDYEEAWSLLETTSPDNNGDRTRMLLLLRAMTAFQLGKIDEAIAALEEARPMVEAALDTIRSGDIRPWSHVYFVHQAFFAEAEELIKGE